MNKEGFNQLVSDYSRAEQNFRELEKLVQEFPYSQPLRMLDVQSSRQGSKSEFQKRLNLAAFYATDRNVLRGLIEHGRVPSDEKKATAPAKTSTTVKVAKKVVKRPSLGKPSEIEALRKEVLANLQQLQKSKALFFEITESGELEIKKEKPAANPKPARKTKSKTNTASPKAIKKSLKAKPMTTRSRTKKDEIIDKFIAEEPSITPNKEQRENQSDLSKPSSVLKEDLVSENLAVIFAKQGKTAKAIEIYKKLIWKFPQKKASFAARIEELKKK